jgi:hypothetical protein
MPCQRLPLLRARFDAARSTFRSAIVAQTKPSENLRCESVEMVFPAVRAHLHRRQAGP